MKKALHRSCCGADMESLAGGILLLRQSRWLHADLTTDPHKKG